MRPRTWPSASITCHSRSILPAVGTNEPIRIPFGLRGAPSRLLARSTRRSASLKGRQTKRIRVLTAALSSIAAPWRQAPPRATSRRPVRSGVRLTEPSAAIRICRSGTPVTRRHHATSGLFVRIFVIRTPWHSPCPTKFRQDRPNFARADALCAGRIRRRPESPAPSQTGQRGVLCRAKSLVGLDLGSSAVKADRAQAGRQELQGRGLRVRADSSRQHRRRRDHRWRRGRWPRSPAAVRDPSIKTRDVAASLSGNAVIVKKISPAGDDRSRAGRVDLLGGRAVHPVRHPGRQPRLPDSRRPRTRSGKTTMDVLLVAAKNEKIADYTGVISAGRAAPPWSSTSTPSRSRTPTRSTTGSSPTRWSSCSTPARAPPTSTSSRGEQSVFTRDISIGGNAYTEALQKELNLPFEQADQLKRGHAGGRRYSTRTPGRCCAPSPRT